MPAAAARVRFEMPRTLLLLAIVGCNGSATPHPPPPPATPQPAAQEHAVQLQAPPATDRSIGTSHPILVEQVADDGSWIAICRARKDTDGDGAVDVGVGMHGRMIGDRLEPYLVFGSGAGTPIDAFVTRSKTGDWLAVIRDGKLVLSDARAQHAVELPDADVRDDGVPFGTMRAAAIADDGSRMTYFRRDQLVVRDLGSQRERVVDIGGAPWRAALDTTGHWALVHVLASGRPWPVAQTTLAARGCRGPVGSFTSGGWTGDKPRDVWVDLETASTVAATRVPVPIQQELESGKRPHPPAVANEIACAQDGQCFDADGTTVKLPAGAVEYASGDRVLLRTGGKLVVFDATARTSAPLDAKGDVTAASEQIVTIGDGLYDLVTRTRIGAGTETVVAHAGPRWLLGKLGPPCTPKPGDMPYACVDGVANPAAGGFAQLPSGPLRWAP